MLPAISNAASVIPRNLKIELPATANNNSTAVMVMQAIRAIWNRSPGVLSTVMARNAGAVAKGSTMTNRELAANKLYSAKVTLAAESSSRVLSQWQTRKRGMGAEKSGGKPPQPCRFLCDLADLKTDETTDLEFIAELFFD